MPLSDMTVTIKLPTLTDNANDTKLLKTVKDSDDILKLQSSLKAIYKWLHENKIKFNAEKFQALKNRPTNSLLVDYKVPSSSTIQVSMSVRDLEIHMNNDATIHVHITKMAGKEIMLVLWRTFVTSLLDYYFKL